MRRMSRFSSLAFGPSMLEPKLLVLSIDGDVEQIKASYLLHVVGGPGGHRKLCSSSSSRCLGEA